LQAASFGVSDIAHYAASRRDIGMGAVIACLGGGLRYGAVLPDHVKGRIIQSIECAKRLKGNVIIFSSSFTLNKPPVLDPNGRICSEASAMARYAVSCGYEGRYYCEQQSHDTIGSAYFLFSDFFSFLHSSKIAVITSDFHVRRAQLIFTHIAKLFNYEREIEFVECKSNIGQDRIEKEEVFFKQYLNDWNAINSLKEFRELFFTNHDNYSINFSSSYQGDMALSSY
jgi:hypothetical protein